MRALAAGAMAAALIANAAACGSDSSGPRTKTRSYLMGFSNFPPAPDTMLQRQSVQQWVTRADAAILHIDPPWEGLLEGVPADSLVRGSVAPLVSFYKSIGKKVAVETDLTNGVDRNAESPALLALGRSIKEDTVQKLYRSYAVSVAMIAQPDYFGLASETNLIRAAAPAGVYPALVAMTNAAAADIRNAGATMPLYVSVQVEVAWGRLVSASAPAYVGIAQDRADFPFVSAYGLSTYPYLAGFTDPSDVPDDYFSRIAQEASLPVLVTEGGWSSANIGNVHSSPAKQQAWINRAATLLDNAHAVAWFQLDFTDINLAAFGFPEGDPQIAPFVSIGLVDTVLAPKPALASWDSIFARTVLATSP